MQTVASLRSRRTGISRTTWLSTTRTLSAAVGASVVAFKPDTSTQLLVGSDGSIALEAFLQAPLTEARTPLRCHQCRWVPFWSFDSKLVLWGNGCMQTTLYIADEGMRHGGHCP